MMRMLPRFAGDQAGSSAAEMAMVLPLLLVLLFGTFDLGYYFLSEHVVQKSVRDAARYAGRLPMTDFPSCAPTTAAETKIQRIARTGQPDGNTQRLFGWSSDTMTTVTMTCDTSGTYTGLFTDFPSGVPVITVSASVPYPTLFGRIGLGSATLTLNAQSQSAVFGA